MLNGGKVTRQIRVLALCWGSQPLALSDLLIPRPGDSLWLGILFKPFWGVRSGGGGMAILTRIRATICYSSLYQPPCW